MRLKGYIYQWVNKRGSATCSTIALGSRSGLSGSPFCGALQPFDQLLTSNLLIRDTEGLAQLVILVACAFQFGDHIIVQGAGIQPR
jgi:hypothetical protein